MSDLRPIGVNAGDNKYKAMRCVWCAAGPSTEHHTYGNFMFRDGRSSTEYRISALCQDCQDATFNSNR